MEKQRLSGGIFDNTMQATRGARVRQRVGWKSAREDAQECSRLQLLELSFGCASSISGQQKEGNAF